MLERYKLIPLFFLIFYGISMRFIALDQSPPGFFVDESGIATQIICLKETGKNFHGVSYPLFSSVSKDGGLVSPPELYTGIAWVTLFGDSISSFRSMAAFFSALTLIGLFFLSTALGFTLESALLILGTAVVSPWTFQFARIAWDPPLGPLFLVWGLYFFLKERKIYSLFLSPLFLAMTLYAYPPFRAQTPLVLLALVWFKNKYSLNKVPPQSWKNLLLFVFSFSIFCIPLILELTQGALQSRFNQISIFQKDYPASFIFSLFYKNILAHFSWNYLFVSGDANLRHSTQSFGELSWCEGMLFIFGLAAWLIPLVWNKLIRDTKNKLTLLQFGKNEIRILLFCLMGYLSGIITASFTAESIPHALRTIGSSLFTPIIAGLIATQVVRRYKPFYLIFSSVLILFFGYFLNVYFTEYPKRAASWFDAGIVNAAQTASTTHNWEPFESSYGKYPAEIYAYYQLHYKKESCESLRARLNPTQ